MNNSLRAAQALAIKYTDKAATDELLLIFESPEPFLTVIKQFDKWLAQHPESSAAADYLFDILLAHHLEKQRDNEDYLFSKEWMDIEDKTIDRGTELLNMLIYISEAKDNDIEIDLTDFMNEFLLVDEDEFQDEHHIYETIIDNAEIMEVERDSFIEALASLNDDNLAELLKPMLLFFYSPDEPMNVSYLTRDEEALYNAILAYAEVE
jgi:hypothetical protein